MWYGECPEISRESPYKHTHSDTVFETPPTDSNDDVLAMTVDNLGARNHETIGVNIGDVEPMSAGTLALGLFPKPKEFVVADLPNDTGLSGGSGFVTLDVVAGNEDTVTGDDLTRFEKDNITDEQLLDVDDALDTMADNLDTMFLLLVIGDAELPPLVPIAEGANHYLQKEG